MADTAAILAFAKNWLYNTTVIPAVGINRCFRRLPLEGQAGRAVARRKGKMSLTWIF